MFDFTFERAPQDTEYLAAVNVTTDVSGRVVTAAIAAQVVAVLLR